MQHFVFPNIISPEQQISRHLVNYKDSKVVQKVKLEKMSTGKKVADFLYRGFTLSMVTLTLYGTAVLGMRFFNMMEERKSRQKALLAAANLEASESSAPSEAINT